MSTQRQSPARPLILIGGIRDTGPGIEAFKQTLAKVLDPKTILAVTLVDCTTFDSCRETLIDTVNQRFPTNDPQWTVPVDVVAISMGGLVARHAAAELGTKRRLKIKRLFTVSTPHRGALLVNQFFGLGPLHRDMKSDSSFLKMLDAHLVNASYKILPYTRLSDGVVGAANTAPPGQTPFWVSAQFLQPSHYFARRDAQILADIMSRLRSEPPIFTTPSPPLPWDG